MRAHAHTALEAIALIAGDKMVDVNDNSGTNENLVLLLIEMMKLNPIMTGGGAYLPPHHVFAYTRVCMRIRVLIFCDFSSF